MTTPAPRLPGRLPQTVTPQAYDLWLSIDPTHARFSGEVTIAVKLEVEVEEIHLHARHLEVRRCEVRLPGGTVQPATVRPAEGPDAEPDYGEVVLTTGHRLPAMEVELYLAFEAPFDPQMGGLYRVEDAGRWYAFTQFEAADARKCFPCFDEPDFKVPFRVTLEVPEGQEAFANTPEAGRETVDGRVRVTFRETKPLPTYLVAFAVGPLAAVEGPAYRVPLRALVPRGKERLAAVPLETLPGLVDALEAWFGRPYPYEKLDVVAVPEFAAGAMENAGLITFREELLLADPARLTESRRRLIAEVIAHEVAHHWFGNLVTMRWWEDLWLNEAFATWMAAKAVDAWDPSFDQVMELLQARSRVMAGDALPAARKVRQEVGGVGEAEQAFDDLTYYKGAAVLTMLEHWVGEPAFQAGVRAYLDHHAWGNATAADLFAHLDEASGQDVTGVARAYLDQPGLPLVTVAPGAQETVLRQRPLSLLGLSPPAGRDARWRIPLKLGEGPWRLLEAEEARVPSADRSVHPNLGEWSYYRWSLPAEALSALAGGADALDARSRLGILDNAWGMVTSGELGPDAYLEVLESLREARERPLVLELVAGVRRVYGVWEEVRDAPGWPVVVERILGPHAERLGFEPRDGEPEDDAILRPQVLTALGILATHRPTLDRAAEVAERYLADPASVSSEVAAAAVGLAAWDGRLPRERLVVLLQAAQDPDQRLAALKGLALLPPGEPLTGALDLTVTGGVRAQDFHYLFRDAMRRPEAREATFGWFERNFEEVRARQSEFTFIHIGSHVGDFRTEDGRDRARAFFESRNIPGGERAIRQGAEQADHAIALRKAGAERLQAHLAQAAPN